MISNLLNTVASYLSRIQLLTSKISHICQEIRDIKSRRRPQTNIAIRNYTNTGLVKEQTSQNYTREPDSSNFAKEGSDGVDGLGEIYSSHSKLRHREPNNPDTPSHHAPTPPSPNPAPSESNLEPPGDLSPSPASKIVTETPSSLSKVERKACSAALSSLVYISPSGPCAVSGNWTCRIYVFFELLFFYVSLAISFYVSLTNLFSIIPFLIC